jgi:hypothetical protein
VKEQTLEATVATVAQKVVYGSAGLSVFGGLTANEIAAFGGLLFAAIGLLVNLYYKRKDDKRKDELHSLRKASRLYTLGDEDDES